MYVSLSAFEIAKPTAEQRERRCSFSLSETQIIQTAMSTEQSMSWLTSKSAPLQQTIHLKVFLISYRNSILFKTDNDIAIIKLRLRLNENQYFRPHQTQTAAATSERNLRSFGRRKESFEKSRKEFPAIVIGCENLRHLFSKFHANHDWKFSQRFDLLERGKRDIDSLLITHQSLHFLLPRSYVR
jgi:hypothetical protein